jgi:16S rRNA processing protein RimM
VTPKASPTPRSLLQKRPLKRKIKKRSKFLRMLVPEGVRAGKISKPYGLRGEVNMILGPRAGKNIEPDNPLFIEVDGQRVPFFVEEVELVSPEQAIIKFEFVDSLETARELTGCEVYFDHHHQPDNRDNKEDLSALVGYNATDIKLGSLGLIADYLPHPMNPIFVLKSGKRELMVPAVMDFIVSIDHGEQVVVFILPEGISTL